jgi:hypothetical protein
MKSIDTLHFFSETATEFAISLIQTLVTQESSSVSELFNVVDALSKVFHLWLAFVVGSFMFLVMSPSWLTYKFVIYDVFAACNQS